MFKGTLYPGLRSAAALAAVLLASTGFAQSREPAGHILWAFGEVERVAVDGTARRLAKGDPVFEGDVIRTAPGSSAQLVMSDEALLALRAESSFKLTKYRYRGTEDGTEAALLDLLKGGVRSITGAVGRTNKETWQLRNEGHVIGIRGTDHETYATEMGTYNRVTLGGTYLQSAGGRVDLAPGEVGFVGILPRSVPARLERTPEFMHVAALANANVAAHLGKEDAQHTSVGSESSVSAAPIGPVSAPRSAGASASVPSPSAAAAVGGPATLPVLPSRAVGPVNGAAGSPSVPAAFGAGGRCNGPCADTVGGRVGGPTK